MNTDVLHVVAMVPVIMAAPRPLGAEIQAVLREMQGDLIEACGRRAMDRMASDRLG